MKQIFITLLLCLLPIFAFSQENDKAVTFSMLYKGDFTGNTVGGLKKGFGYLGYGLLGINLNTENAGWWNGGELNVVGASTHGMTPSEKMVGDFQYVNNQEAGNHAYLSQFWYRQTFADKVRVSFGLQDLNADYAVCDAAGMFLNSSFGINSVFTNIATPIFPVTGLGLNLRWNISDKFVWQAAVYDGGALDFDENPYNIKWKLSKSKGYTTITEGQFVNEREDVSSGVYDFGVYKFGVSYHTGEKDVMLYANIDQKVWRNCRHEIGVFVSAACALNTNRDDDKTLMADDYLYNDVHIAAGANLKGVFSKMQKDVLGVAFTTSLFSDFADDRQQETALELLYKYQIFRNLYLQPDVQYVINPSTKLSGLDNALVATLRFGLEF